MYIGKVKCHTIKMTVLRLYFFKYKKKEMRHCDNVIEMTLKVYHYQCVTNVVVMYWSDVKSVFRKSQGQVEIPSRTRCQNNFHFQPVCQRCFNATGYTDSTVNQRQNACRVPFSIPEFDVTYKTMLTDSRTYL